MRFVPGRKLRLGICCQSANCIGLIAHAVITSGASVPQNPIRTTGQRKGLRPFGEKFAFRRFFSSGSLHANGNLPELIIWRLNSPGRRKNGADPALPSSNFRRRLLHTNNGHARLIHKGRHDLIDRLLEVLVCASQKSVAVAFAY